MVTDFTGRLSGFGLLAVRLLLHGFLPVQFQVRPVHDMSRPLELTIV